MSSPIGGLGAGYDLNSISRADLNKALMHMDPCTREVAQLGLSHALANTGHADRLLGKAKDTFSLGKGGGIQMQNQPSLGSQPATAGPHSNYSQRAAQTAGTYFQFDPSQVKEARIDRRGGGAFVLSGKQLGRVLNAKDGKYVSADNPEGFKFPSLRNKVIQQHGLVQGTNGAWLAPAQSQTAAAFSQVAPGQQASSSVGKSTLGFLQRTSWLMPAMGFLGGGIGGLIGGFVASKALKSVSSGMSGGGMQSALGGVAPGLAGLGLGGNALGSASGAGFYGTAASAASFMGLDGMAFNMRKIMNSKAEDFKDDAMIGMINNPGIPIEDLIFMFMAHMGDKYEKKLREKMEEAALAEKKERKREQDKQKASMIGGICSIIPGVGPIIGSAIQMGMQEKTRIREALDGNSKSSTVLMQEVQMLMHKWKQLNEMLSNLMKAMHDMAMTPIRNMR